MFVMTETRKDKGLTIAKVDLFYALQVQMGSCRSFPPVGPMIGGVAATRSLVAQRVCLPRHAARQA